VFLKYQEAHAIHKQLGFLDNYFMKKKANTVNSNNVLMNTDHINKLKLWICWENFCKGRNNFAIAEVPTKISDHSCICSISINLSSKFKKTILNNAIFLAANSL